MNPLSFKITHKATDCAARVGRIETPHGCIDTPAFMPVGTQGSIKGLLPDTVAATGSQVVLANTYHLMLRPGSKLVADMGGLQKWMRWDGPILTDSGGYQVFSLADLGKINDQGVVFKSHLDGATIELTAERSMQVQNELGADIIMAFDDCPPSKRDFENPEKSDAGRKQGQSYQERVDQACDRSACWLDRCVKAHGRADEQALFGIVQGGTQLELRRKSVEQVCAHDLPGYAIGGVAVGEGFAGLKSVVEFTAPLLPEDRPCYLMGVGYEHDLVTAIRAGVDMFDCVLPTRNGRNANAFTSSGQIRLRNAIFARDTGPIDPDCDCQACGGGYSRSYLRHLFMTSEMLGPILVSLHNIRHFQRLLLDIRKAIADNDWSLVFRRWPVAKLPRPDRRSEASASAVDGA
jgi:queuine tRNA-ribosyltransferase